MNNIVNICFSESAGGTFRVAIKMNEMNCQQKVIVLSDDLSQGAIKGGVNLEERINWWNTIDEEKYFADYDDKELKKIYNDFRNEISKIDNNDTIYLWYGSSKEFCGMLYTLELLKDRDLNIYLINVTDSIIRYKDNVYLVKSTGEIMPDNIEKYASLKQKLDSNKYEELLSTWKLLKKDNSILRIFKKEKIKSEDENYFDIDILKYTPQEFRKSARIVGSVMGNSEIEISDDYIFWRVKELVKCGKIDYSGKFGIMREMEVKITEEGLKQLSADQNAMSVWESNKKSLDIKENMIKGYIEQGRLEEKINIAKKLKNILDSEIIADKTGLTIGQVKKL